MKLFKVQELKYPFRNEMFISGQTNKIIPLDFYLFFANIPRLCLGTKGNLSIEEQSDVAISDLALPRTRLEIACLRRNYGPVIIV